MSSHFDTAKARGTAHYLERYGHLNSAMTIRAACDEVDRLRAALTEAETALREIERCKSLIVNDDDGALILNRILAAAVSGSKPA